MWLLDKNNLKRRNKTAVYRFLMLYTAVLFLQIDSPQLVVKQLKRKLKSHRSKFSSLISNEQASIEDVR